MNKKKSIIAIVVLVILAIVAIVAWVDIRPAKAPEVSGNIPIATSTVPVGASSTPSSTGASASSSNMTIDIKKFYSNGSFSFSYPSAWTIETYIPFSMNNFNGKYAPGGIIPEGGAAIQVVTSTSYGPLQDIMTTQLMSATNVATSTVVVDGSTCSKANYENTYATGVASKDISVYCKRGTSLWEIFLSYRADDSAGSAHVADLSSVLDSMKLLQ